jgi:integrase
VAKPRQERTREPRPVAPYYVELIRRHMLDPSPRRDNRGRRHARRPELDRHRDATLVSLLAYSGPRPESEALPLRWRQIGERTLTYHATKAGRVKPRRTRLLAPLARDLAEFRIRCGRPGDDELVFGEWSGNDWDNWRERIFQPAAIAVGLPDDTIPRDLRGSFASLLIFEGLNVLEVAPQLGHKPSTCLDIYGRLFVEFDPSRRRPAVDVIREAREAIRERAVPTGYPAAVDGDAESDVAAVEEGD